MLHGGSEPEHQDQTGKAGWGESETDGGSETGGGGGSEDKEGRGEEGKKGRGEENVPKVKQTNKQNVKGRRLAGGLCRMACGGDKEHCRHKGAAIHLNPNPPQTPQYSS